MSDPEMEAADPELEAIRRRKLERLLDEREALLTMQAAPDHPITVTTEDLDATLTTYETVLLDLWAPWCGPCRALAPVLDRLAAEKQGQLVIAKLNVDEDPRASQRFGVQGIPTMILFHHGEEVDRIVGALPEPQLEARIARSTG